MDSESKNGDGSRRPSFQSELLTVEEQMTQAKPRIKQLKRRVEQLKGHMEAYMKTVTTWQQSQEQTLIFCVESVDANAGVAKVMLDFSQNVSQMKEHVTSDLAQMFESAVLDPLVVWLGEFKGLKELLKEYFEAKSQRNHYVKKMQTLRTKLAKGKNK